MKQTIFLLVLAFSVAAPDYAQQFHQRRQGSGEISFTKQNSVSGASPATYYVSVGGQDSNPGTEKQPWKTLARVNRQHYGPGDTILLQGGLMFSGPLIFDAQDGGLASNPVRISSFGTGRATINGGKHTAIQITNSGGYVIENLNIVGSGVSTNDGYGIYFVSHRSGSGKFDFVLIRSVDVSGFLQAGIQFNADDLYGFSHVTITCAVAHDNGDTGISTFGRFVTDTEGDQPYAHENVRVEHSSAYRNQGNPNSTSNTGSGIELDEVNGAVIERCTAHDNGGVGQPNSGGPVGIWTYDSTHVVIQYNESYANQTGNGADGGGFDLDGGVSWSTMQYNYSHDNAGNGFLLTQFASARTFEHNTIRYNISENDGRQNGAAGLLAYAQTPIVDTSYFNNTVFVSPSSDGPAAIRILPYSVYRGLSFRDNILYTTGGVPLVDAPDTTGISFNGNLYFSSDAPPVFVWGGVTYGSLEAWRKATGQEVFNKKPTGIAADPLLVAPGKGGTIGNPVFLDSLKAYQLRPGSPAIDAALDLQLFGIDPGSHDFYGNPKAGKAWDIGAAEYQPPASTTSN